MSAEVDPSRLLTRDFDFESVTWNTYEIDHKHVKGRLRLLSVISELFEIPVEMLPAGSKTPQFQPIFGNMSRFLNDGDKSEGNRTPLTQEEFGRRPREDITSFITRRDEPVSRYVVRGEAALLLTTQTKLSKISYVKFRANAFGDPIIVAESNTTHTVTPLKPGDSRSPADPEKE